MTRPTQQEVKAGFEDLRRQRREKQNYLRLRVATLTAMEEDARTIGKRLGLTTKRVRELQKETGVTEACAR